MSLTRRTLLGLAVATALAGCRPRHRATPTASGPGDAGVEAAIEAERTLLDAYAAAIAVTDAVTAGPLTAARDRHEQHLQALVAAAHTASPTGTPTSLGGPSPTNPTALVASLTTSAAALQAAAVRAEESRIAGLLASIAAEHSADAALGPGAS